jgi:hypothetical protein
MRYAADRVLRIAVVIVGVHRQRLADPCDTLGVVMVALGAGW